MLTILDEFTRECHVLRADRALKSADVLEWMGRAIAEHGAPGYLRSDNGPEPEQRVDSLPQAARRASEARQFIAKEVQRWLAENRIKTIYIDPGSPWQNGFVERLPRLRLALRAACGRLSLSGRLHGRLRDECLNREHLWTLTEARVVIEDYRREYNHHRPHSKLGYQSPKRFAATQSAPSPAPVALRAPYAGDGQNQTDNVSNNPVSD
jgi:transposase InsO family protein